MKAEELSKHMSTHFSSEIDGANAYLDMAEKAEEMGENELMNGLLDMAEDEYSHAEFIKTIMDDKHVEIPAEMVHKFEELEKRMDSIFC